MAIFGDAELGPLDVHVEQDGLLGRGCHGSVLCGASARALRRVRPARGYTYGEEYYGTFFRALYTLFQMLLESRSEVCSARDALPRYVNPQIGAVLTVSSTSPLSSPKS